MCFVILSILGEGCVLLSSVMAVYHVACLIFQTCSSEVKYTNTIKFALREKLNLLFVVKVI
jgi:hypothetical protein